MAKIRLTALALLLLGAFTAFFVYSSEITPEAGFKIKLGLDLDGELI